MITKIVNGINRSIDGFHLTDQELLALVKKAYLRTAKICSRGLYAEMHNEHYASAIGAMHLAFGEDFLSNLGASEEWQVGFLEGFEYLSGRTDWRTGKPIEYPLPRKGEDFNDGFDRGQWVANEVFRNWPDSPNIYSKPQI